MTTTSRPKLKDLGPEDLRVANATDKQLTADLHQLRTWKGRFLGYAVLAWSYQKGIISANEFDLLYWWKVRDNGLNHSDKQMTYRANLVVRITRALEKWANGDEVKPHQRRAKNDKVIELKPTPSKKELAAKRKAAREQFYAEMREKRAKK